MSNEVHIHTQITFCYLIWAKRELRVNIYQRCFSPRITDFFKISLSSLWEVFSFYISFSLFFIFVTLARRSRDSHKDGIDIVNTMILNNHPLPSRIKSVMSVIELVRPLGMKTPASHSYVVKACGKWRASTESIPCEEETRSTESECVFQRDLQIVDEH